VFEVDANPDTDVRCYTFAGGLIGAQPTAGCALQSETTPIATTGATEFYEVTIPAPENFYDFTIQSRDAAGNLSETTIARNALIDVTAGPNFLGVETVEVDDFTISNANNTATVNGTLNDNIEIDEYDARFEFVGLLANDGSELPDAVPFTTPVNVGDYGLPLVGSQAVSATTQVNVDAIARTPADVAPFVVTNFGFGMTDLAENFDFGGIAVTPGPHNGFPAGFTAFNLNSPAAIDRTPSGGSVGSRTLTATATTGVADSNPLIQVYFYYVNPGPDLVYDAVPGGDDSFVLISSVGAGSATVLTGETVREFRFNTTLSASMLPPNTTGFPFRVIAIGVAADGDAVMTEVETVAVSN
jgi:hypothetical protein